MDTFKLKSDIGKLIYNGYDREGIKRTISAHPEYKNLDGEKKKDFLITLDRLIDANNNYKNVKSILESKILMFIDTNRNSLYDPEAHTERPVSWDAITRSVKVEVIRDQMIQCTKVYDPRTKAKFFTIGKSEFFNAYMPPYWLHDHFFYDVPVPEATLPAVYHEFFSAFVNNSEKNYNYLINWAAHSLKAKNNAALTLVGKEGTGKSLLASVLGAVHGNDSSVKNFNNIRGTTLGSQFNSNIADRTLINIDEIFIKDETEFSYFKTLVNDTIEVERKGQDSQNQANFSNLVMSTNNTSSFRLGPNGDRRFAIVDLTEIPLIKQKFIKNGNTKEYVDKLLDPANIAQLGQFLWHYKVDIKLVSEPYISATKDKIRKSQLSDWKEHFLESYCKEKAGDKVPYTTVVSDLSMQLDQSSSRLRIKSSDFTDLLGQVAAFPGSEGKWMFKLARERNAETNQRGLVFTFAELEEQPENLMENFSKNEGDE